MTESTNERKAAHEPVLAEEVADLLGPVLPGGRLVDATVGLGGHALALAAGLGPDGRLLGLDRDPLALEQARQRLEGVSCSVQLHHGCLEDLNETLDRLGFTPVDGILLDLGVSSLQLDQAGRGFSFQQEGPLDMRMDQSEETPTAAELLRTLPQEELSRLFFEYGEERFARRIASAIVRRRQTQALETTAQLAELVRSVVPRRRGPQRIHPATRVFQALRIAVNRELDQIQPALQAAVRHTRPGGRIAVIAFHSLEDRLVKHQFQHFASTCVCPPRQPICTCNHQPVVRRLTRKPLRPGEAEIARNPRARSARLRAVERLEEVLHAA